MPNIAINLCRILPFLVEVVVGKGEKYLKKYKERNMQICLKEDLKIR